jgi:DNA-directed RNA polymerase specialized sigma24 family protein
MAGRSTGAYGVALDGSASGSARRKDSRILTVPDIARSRALLTPSASVTVMSRAGSDGSAWRRVRRAFCGRSGARTRTETVPRHTETSPDAWVTALYGAHYGALVRLAALLIGDIAVAETVVQDAFVALYHTGWRQDSDRELFYLRRAVIRRSRSVGQRAIPRGDASKPVPCRTKGGRHVTAASQGYSAMISALYRLPARQREAVLLCYYSKLPEEQIANIMGLSRRAVARLLEGARVSLRPLPAGAVRRSAQRRPPLS